MKLCISGVIPIMHVEPKLMLNKGGIPYFMGNTIDLDVWHILDLNKSFTRDPFCYTLNGSRIQNIYEFGI